MDTTNDGDKHENGIDANSIGLQPVEDAFPSTDNLDEEVCDLPLELCMRLVPHDQNTGAFFIAVLQKVSPLPGIDIRTGVIFLDLSVKVLAFVY